MMSIPIFSKYFFEFLSINKTLLNTKKENKNKNKTHKKTKKLLLNLHKLFQKTEVEGKFSSLFYEASMVHLSKSERTTLISKPTSPIKISVKYKDLNTTLANQI